MDEDLYLGYLRTMEEGFHVGKGGAMGEHLDVERTDNRVLIMQINEETTVG
jgi:hypothetical protein